MPSHRGGMLSIAICSRQTPILRLSRRTTSETPASPLRAIVWHPGSIQRIKAPKHPSSAGFQPRRHMPDICTRRSARPSPIGCNHNPMSMTTRHKSNRICGGARQIRNDDHAGRNRCIRARAVLLRLPIGRPSVCAPFREFLGRACCQVPARQACHSNRRSYTRESPAFVHCLANS